MIGCALTGSFTDEDASWKPVMDGYCAGGCGANITDAENYDPLGVGLIRPWLFTDTPRGYLRVRCPGCQGLVTN